MREKDWLQGSSSDVHHENQTVLDPDDSDAIPSTHWTVDSSNKDKDDQLITLLFEFKTTRIRILRITLSLTPGLG